MKNTFRRIGAILLAAALTLSLGAAAIAAEATYTITINNKAGGHTYEAYQIFSGDLEGSVLSNVQWGKGVDGAKLLTALKADGTIGSKFTNATGAADVAKAMNGTGNDSAEAQAFAQVVGQNLTATVSGTSSQDGDVYKISSLEAGYYLVKDKDGTQGDQNDAYTRFVLEVVKDVSADPKTGNVNVEKKVKENVKYTEDKGYGAGYNDVADYSIGDTVPFELIGTLPANYADYSSYDYEFHDTMSKGLTIDESSVKVTVDYTGKDITSSFTTKVTANSDGTTAIDVTCADLKKTDGLSSGSKIVVSYNAKLNKDAVVGLDGNPNEVYLTYSNNPNQGGTGDKGKTPTDKVIVFTYELDTTKQDGDTKAALADAQFVLYKTVSGTNHYATVENGRLTGWTTDRSKATTLVSDSKGLFKVAGLDDGSYALEETKAPAGYNLLTSPVTLTISATTDNGQNWAGVASAALTALKITIGGKTTDGDAKTGVVSATVDNNKGATLPTTGGIGTTIFYVIGSLLAAGAALLLITKKRIANKEK